MTATRRPAEADPRTLAPEVTARLLADGPRIADRLARRLVEEIPLGPEFRTPRYLRSVVAASRDGLLTLLRRLHDGSRAQPAELAGLGVAGARQAELGVPLEILLSGYRLAAKVVWREVVNEATRLGQLSPETVVFLSDQVLEYLDDISGAVGRAYLDTRDRLIRQRDRERDRVLQRLLAGDASTELRRLAATCDLELTPPYRLLALSTDPSLDADRLLGSAWHRARALIVADAPGMWVALVAADADVAALRTAGASAVPGLVVGIGPVAGSLEEVAGAAREALDALAVGSHLDPAAEVHDHRDIAPFTVMASDPERLSQFATHVLGPLVGGDARNRALLATLEAALRTRSLGEAAGRLRVHRHTVVYRLGRIHELLGVDLDDPAQRQRLWLALTALSLLRADVAVAGGSAEEGYFRVVAPSSASRASMKRRSEHRLR